MNPDLVLEVPDTPDRISRSIEILPNPRIGDHRFRRPNLSLKHRNSSNTREEESSLSINQNTSTVPNNNNERKRKSPIDLTSGESSNSDRNKKGKGVMQEREGTRVGPIARDNKGKGKMNPNNEAMREKSPTTVQSGTPRRVGQRWLVRNGCIAPSNIAKRNTEMQPTTGGSSNGETGEDATAQKASVAETEAGRNTRIQLPASGVSRQTGGHGPSRQTGGPGPSRHPVGPGPSRQPSEPGPSRHTRGPGSRIERRPEDPRINEIVAGSLYEGPSSRSKPLANNNATTSTTTNGWRTTANHRPLSNPTATAGSSRAATSPTREALRNRLARPSLRGSSGGRRVRSLGASSSSNPTRNQVVTDLTTPPPTRGRVVGVRISEPEPVIDLDAMSTPGSGSDSGLARARQMAHDEWLARQLQDEFNTETQVPSSLFSMEEIDARIAMSLQQEENARCATAASVSLARGGGRTASRAARGRVRGRRGSGSNQIPLNLAMQMSLDFNANDYEALLALDENNHMHTGASSYQINNLPESVVRTDNFEEPCAVCLEKPAIGETIRHLPCLHKFHKDCIDMWLQRKKECPVCKCGINGTGLPA